MSSVDPSSGGAGDPGSVLGEVVGGRFRLDTLASAGAYTAIYTAVDEATGRPVTCKLVRTQLATAPSFRTAFGETMRGAAALSHPNIAAVFDWGFTPVGATSTAYVVTEYLSGGSLRDLFDRGRRLSPSQALAVGLDACRGLDHAHRRGFVHSELTPSKLVFGDDRRLRIVDFGLARILGAAQWERPETVDNHVAWYSAPEMGLQQGYDGRADVYSLCLSLHEAVTGDLPFRSDSTVASLAARVGRLMPVSADLGPLAAVLERAGRPDPSERSDAAEFGKALVQAASKLPRPEPLPLLSSGLFDTPAEQLRSPDDPTGGLRRPVVVVPVDEPDPVVPTGAAVASDDSTGLLIRPLDVEIDAPVTAEPSPPAARPDATSVLPVVTPLPAAAHRRRRVGPMLAIVASVLVTAVVLALLATRLFSTAVYAVPDLTGLPRAEALNLIAPNDWLVEEVDEASDVVPVVGQVVRTTPAAGSELAEGEPFLLVVSTGPVPRELPESTGVALPDAESRLRDRDLQVEVVEDYDEEVPLGIVVSWSVPGDPTLSAGSTVPPETIVQLVVSKGPSPRVVPDLVGDPAADGPGQIEPLLLVYAEAGQEFSDTVPAGAIIRQDPPPGAEVERGTTVTVVVSKGVDLVVFPDLGPSPTFEAAAVLLREAGFDPVLRFGDAQGAIQEITVDGAAPEVGGSYRRGTVVDVVAL